MGVHIFFTIMRLIQDLRSMILSVHLLDNLYKNTLFVKDEGLPERAHSRLSIHLLLSPCTECLKDFG